MHWAEKTKSLIESKGLTYSHIEQRAQWAKNTLLYAVKRRTDIGAKKALRLARALCVPMDWLFDESAGMPPPSEREFILNGVESVRLQMHRLIEPIVLDILTRRLRFQFSSELVPVIDTPEPGTTLNALQHAKLPVLDVREVNPPDWSGTDHGANGS